MPEAGVVDAAHAHRSGEAIPIEGLLGVIVDIDAIAAPHKVEHAHIAEGEIGYIRDLSGRIDGVAEIGGMHILVAHLEPHGGRPDRGGIVRRQGGSSGLREMEIAIEALPTVPLIAIVIGTVGRLRIEAPCAPTMRVLRRAECGASGIELVLRAEAIVHTCARILPLGTELHIQPAVARLEVDIG